METAEENEKKEEEEEETQKGKKKKKGKDITLEEKDFRYIKKQLKFDGFMRQMHQLDYESQSTDLRKGGDEGTKEEKKFTYSRTGLVVYDIEARMILDKDGPIQYASYDQFVTAKMDMFPEKAYTKQFDKYVSTLAPFVGLESASKAEKRICEFLPPFKRQKEYPMFYELLVPNTATIVLFNSKFESGNLKKAVRIAGDEYNLYLEFDLNSRNYT